MAAVPNSVPILYSGTQLMWLLLTRRLFESAVLTCVIFTAGTKSFAHSLHRAAMTLPCHSFFV